MKKFIFFIFLDIMKNIAIEIDHAAEVEKGKGKENIENEVKTGNCKLYKNRFYFVTVLMTEKDINFIYLKFLFISDRLY